MKEYVKFFDGLPLIVKIILCLPGLDSIFAGIYRICKGHIIAGIIWILCGWAILWIIDIVNLIMHGKLTVFA
ncbi:MAG: hypothetical protein WCX10_09140 [Bacteroidales bacterium]